MTTDTQTPTDETLTNIEVDVAEDRYGALYEFYRCTSCGVEAGQRWQVEQACTCGDA